MEDSKSMKFSMPFDEEIEIRTSRNIDDLEIAIDQEVEGVFYSVYWKEECMPFIANTMYEAIVLSLGCQWGAHQMFVNP
jgi:hypothetical protein